MPRVKGGFKTSRYHKKIIKRAKGYSGAKSKLYKSATLAVDKALLAAYKDRKLKKREFRSLWTIRINAAVREMGMTYSKFINALKKSNILLDRKSLSELAYNDITAFKNLVEQVKK